MVWRASGSPLYWVARAGGLGQVARERQLGKGDQGAVAGLRAAAGRLPPAPPAARVSIIVVVSLPMRVLEGQVDNHARVEGRLVLRFVGQVSAVRPSFIFVFFRVRVLRMGASRYSDPFCGHFRFRCGKAARVGM